MQEIFESMTERQNQIYEGLKSIGSEIAVFYRDAVSISKFDLETKPYLLSHLCREIESGLRDILAAQSRGETKVCKTCSRPLTKGHKKSILNSLGIKEETSLVKKWHMTAKEFSKFAHRHGVWKNPREKIAFDKYWETFEDILDYLVGNYYALADRLDSIVEKEPSKEIIETLPNLLKLESRFIYFFNNLKDKRWLRYLYEAGYFSGSSNPEPIEVKENPGFLSMPYWGVLKYLETVSNENYEINDPEISNLILNIIKEISSYKKQDARRIENYHTDYILFKVICSLPNGRLSKDHTALIKTFVHSTRHSLICHDFDQFLTRAIEEQNEELVIEALKILFSYRVKNDTFTKIETVFESYQFTNIISTKKDVLLEKFAEQTYQLVLGIVEELLGIDKFAFGTFNLPAIEEHEQTVFADNIECQLIYLISASLEKLSEKQADAKIKDLLNSNELILIRVAIHAINKRFKEFENLLWQLNYNPLDLIDAKHEVYELLKDHATDFEEGSVTRVLNMIENAKYYISDEIKENPKEIEKLVAYRKKEWLSAIAQNKDPRIADLIEQLNAINDRAVPHPGFNSWHSGLIGNISPLSVDEILRMNLKETKIYYEDFERQQNDFLGPSPSGFLDNLTMAIRQNPEHFTTDLGIPKDANLTLLNAWITGLQQSWREEKKVFECSEVLAFCLEILSNEDFWVQHNLEERENLWFVSTLITFLEDGTRNYDQAFDQVLLPTVKNILILIHLNNKVEISDYTELSMKVLNNSKGKIYSAMLQYSLRIARLEKKEKDRWDTEIRLLFDEKIKSEKNDLLLFYVTGQFLPNLKYLDTVWVEENFNEIFPIGQNETWRAAIAGYFFHHRQVYIDIFTLFEKHNHLEHALTNAFNKLESYVQESII